MADFANDNTVLEHLESIVYILLILGNMIIILLYYKIFKTTN